MALDARPGPRLTFSSPRQIGSPQPRAAIPRPTLRSILPRRLGRSPLRPGLDELVTGPIRGELLGAEHLADRARAVAKAQRVAPRRARPRHRLLERLDETRQIVADAHDRLAAAAERDHNVGPAGEWLLDNIHVVQEHILEVRESLPSGYYRELPELAAGALVGYPRVYEIAITLISHTEARVELDDLTLFVAAFQEVSPLRIGELWALPAMLRLGLIESVRRMALRSVRRLDELEAADMWAARFTRAAAADGGWKRRSPSSSTDPPSSRPPSSPASSSSSVSRPAPSPGSARWSCGSRSRDDRGGRQRARHRARGADPGDDGEQHHQSPRRSPGWTGKRSSRARAPSRWSCAATRPESTRG